jgi:3-methyladenine DNA glycosylase/8-oxoguanine DNA glycosylase
MESIDMMSPDQIKRGLEFLKSRDDVLSKLIKQNGFEFKPLNMTPYEALLQSVIYQQLSYRAARATLNRFLGLYGGYPDPKRLLSTDVEVLRKTGLSSKKITYLKEVASYASTHGLELDKLNMMKDDEIVRELDAIKGIGLWTVHMLLIFILGRLDVFPASDLGIRKAIKLNYNLSDIPSEREAFTFSKRWKPYRSLAALILWRSLDKTPWP